MNVVHRLAHFADRHAALALAVFSSLTFAFSLSWSLLALVHPLA